MTFYIGGIYIAPVIYWFKLQLIRKQFMYCFDSNFDEHKYGMSCTNSKNYSQETFDMLTIIILKSIGYPAKIRK